MATAARTALPAGSAPTFDAVALRIVYYFEFDPPDVDNVIKPIQDALIGVVYHDDRQVVSAQSLRTEINGHFIIRRASSIVLMAFAQGDPFVHVVVDLPPDMRRL